MKTTISPELQEKLDYILGKSQGYITYSAIQARLDNEPAEIQKEILDSEEFKKYSMDYVLGETQKEKISFSGSAHRVSQLEKSIRSFVINSEVFNKLALDYVLAKEQKNKISLSAAQKRMELIPEEMKTKILINSEVQAAYPGIN